jgi:4-hydroxybenzoate polyprenyltransferase
MGERVSITVSFWWESFKRTVRWTDWYGKIALFMVAMYYAGLRSDLDADRLLLLYGLLLVFACASSCYGYMVNDLFDRSVDRVAGKPNALATLSQPVAIALVAASCALGLIIAIPLLSTAVGVALVIVTYGLITVYSAPPVRFKERGVGALLVATATQRTLPALIIFHTLGVWDQTTIIFSAFISVVGIHHVTAHQIMDAENDRRDRGQRRERQ